MEVWDPCESTQLDPVDSVANREQIRLRSATGHGASPGAIPRREAPEKCYYWRMSDAAAKAIPFQEMSTDELILHVQELWDIIAARAEEIEVPPDQRAELRRRLAAHRAEPGAARPWHEIRADIEKAR